MNIIIEKQLKFNRSDCSDLDDLDENKVYNIKQNIINNYLWRSHDGKRI